MKNLCRFLLMLIFLSAGFQLLPAQWSKANGPFSGGWTSNLLMSGKNLVAATTNGIFFSTDRGRTWTQAYKGFPDVTEDGYPRISLAACGEEMLFAGTQYHGVFRSADHGITWTEVNTGLKDQYGWPLHILDIAALGTEIFTSTTGGLFSSVDNGEHWKKVESWNSKVGIPDLIVEGGTMIAVNNDVGAFLSTDKGATWSEVMTDSMYGYIQGFAASGPNLFGATDSGVYRSRDNGATWSKAGSSWPRVRFPYSYYAITIAGSELYVGTAGRGIFRSTDDGENWQAISDGLNTSAGSTVWAIDKDLFVGAFGCIFHSTNDGGSWDSLAVDFDVCYVNALAVSGPNYFAAAGKDGILLSTDEGVSWKKAAIGVTKPEIYSIAVSGKNIFAGSGDGSIYRSTDNGMNWSAVSDSSLDWAALHLLTVGENLYAGTMGEGVYRSSDNGAHWAAAKNGLPSAHLRDLVACGGTLFAGTDVGVYRSTNNGVSWSAVNTGLIDRAQVIIALAVSGTNLFAGTAAGVFRSSDNGAHWIAVNAGLPSACPGALCASGKNIFASTSSGVFLSLDSGESWKRVIDDLPAAGMAERIMVSGGMLIAYSGHHGIWRRPLSDEPDPTALPTRCSLDQNFPNPFNPTTSIKFNLSSDAMVTLKIFDALGREVSTLVSETLPAGSYVRHWNAAGYASGVYFYRLTSGSFTETRKLLLIR